MNVQIYSDIKVIAEHRLAEGMVLTPGPGVGREFLAPEVEQRSLDV